MRLLVCGGRDFADREWMFFVLDHFHRMRPITLLIHGAYRGADAIAKEWAEARGIPDLPYPADWAALGPAAGPIRNQRMIDDGKPDVVMAFPGGNGTMDMLRRARAAGIESTRIPK